MLGTNILELALDIDLHTSCWNFTASNASCDTIIIWQCESKRKNSRTAIIYGMLELQAFNLCAKIHKLRQTKRSGGAVVMGNVNGANKVYESPHIGRLVGGWGWGAPKE